MGLEHCETWGLPYDYFDYVDIQLDLSLKVVDAHFLGTLPIHRYEIYFPLCTLGELNVIDLAPHPSTYTSVQSLDRTNNLAEG
jgi:hypothetical protein